MAMVCISCPYFFRTLGYKNREVRAQDLHLIPQYCIHFKSEAHTNPPRNIGLTTSTPLFKKVIRIGNSFGLAKCFDNQA